MINEAIVIPIVPNNRRMKTLNDVTLAISDRETDACRETTDLLEQKHYFFENHWDTLILTSEA